MRFTAEQYDAVIHLALCGKVQLEPDGNFCAVCGDTDHQAWECSRNPLVAMYSPDLSGVMAEAKRVTDARAYLADARGRVRERERELEEAIIALHTACHEAVK